MLSNDKPVKQMDQFILLIFLYEVCLQSMPCWLITNVLSKIKTINVSLKSCDGQGNTKSARCWSWSPGHGHVHWICLSEPDRARSLCWISQAYCLQSGLIISSLTSCASGSLYFWFQNYFQVVVHSSHIS